MRTARQLTSSERWELGLFLSMLVVGCLCLTAILNLPAFPHIFAVAPSPSHPSRTPAATPSSDDQIPTVHIPGVNFSPIVPLISVEPLPNFTLDPQPAPKSHSFASDFQWYKGTKYRFVKTLRLRVTAYAPDGRCCWPYPGTTTATGLSVKTNHGHLVAADPRLIPMHALVAVPGYENGAPVPVLDQGGAIKGYRLDVMLPSFDAAKQWGSRLVNVKIYEPLND